MRATGIVRKIDNTGRIVVQKEVDEVKIIAKKLYVILMENKNKLNLEVIKRHVEHLRCIDQGGNLYLCGPFSDYAGGMVVISAASFDEAKRIAESDPFIAEGFKTYEVRSLEVANKDNNYLI